MKPNRSANWVQTKHLFLLLAFTSLGIATAWSFAGAWVILPFAGFEVGLLAFLMHRVCFATYQQQVVRFHDDTILVQLGVYKPSRGWMLDKTRAQVIVTEPNHTGGPMGLSLKDNKHAVELGAFLNVDDKKHVLDKLKLLGLRTSKRAKPVQMSF